MKLKQFRRQLRREGIDMAFLVHPDPNITYFTQVIPSKGFLLITPRVANLYLSKLDGFSQINQIRLREIPKMWTKKLRNEKIRKIGINKQALTVYTYEKIRKTYPRARFVDISSQLNELRMEKTPEEMKKLRRACKVTSGAFDALVKELSGKSKRKLKTEQDVADFLERFIKNKRCELAFPTIAAMGKNGAIPHHLTSRTKLRRGFLLLDFGAKYQNYHADMSRVIFLGTATNKEKEFYDLLLNAQKEACNSISEGVSCVNVDKVARTCLKEYSSHFIHALGHGVGIEIHEHPSFKDEERKIYKNSVFTIEPGIYFPGKFGLRIEDTILFDGKVKVLTKARKDLISVPL